MVSKLIKIKEIIDQIKVIQNKDFSLPETKQEVLNLLETLCGIALEQEKENQELKDEINRLKEEKGKPKFKEKSQNTTNDQQSDLDVKPEKNWSKSSKKGKVKIDRTEIVPIAAGILPPDAEFKGYEEKIVQNIEIKTDNVLYKLEKYYSPSEKKTYTAEVDESIQGTEFGPETKALISTLYFENRVTENKIASFLNSNGIYISEGTVSNILIKEQSEELTNIKSQILEAGLKSSIYHQIDDTGMKIDDKSGFATILCNEVYSVFFINLSKSRDTVKSFLTEFLVCLFIVLVGDDAPQFKKVAKRYALCWVHEDRLFKKLNPILECHRLELTRIRDEIWKYYERLKAYKLDPTEETKSELWEDFNVLFGQETTYEALNERLTLTMKKKNELLAVLDYPVVPLHNNLSEVGIREMVIKRKISGGVETQEGLIAWENNMSILETCKKLGISFYDFMRGIYSKKITIDLTALINSKQTILN